MVMHLDVQPRSLRAGAWHVYTVDASGEVGTFNSIAVDRYGRPHISYFDAANFDLKYAQWTGTNWSVETVDSDGYVGTDTSIALDSQGYPHISYRAINSTTGWNHLKYASWTGNRWSIETLDTAYSTAFYTSQAIDKSGDPHISYFEGWSQYKIRYASRNSSAWSLDSVDTVTGTSTRTSLALDSQQYPHIAYYQGFPGYTLKHSWWNGSEWKNESLPGTRYVCGYASLALDSLDVPHLTYQSFTDNNIRYASRTSGGWNANIIDWAGNACTYSALALDGADRARVAYSETGRHSLRCAEQTGTGWIPETVNSTDFVTTHISIALDAGDAPHISYYEENGRDLKYATKVELGPGPEPALSFSPPSIDFGTLPPRTADTGTFEVWNSGGNILNYSFDKSVSWITAISPAIGSSAGEHDVIAVSINTTGLSLGLHTSSVSIFSNGGNGTIDVTVNVTGPPRHVDLRITPRTLNLKSEGQWITAHLEFENASANDVNASSLLLNDVVPPSWWKILGNGTLMVKFDRAAVQSILSVGDAVDVKVTGQWIDGGSFEAHDTIRVIDPGS